MSRTGSGRRQQAEQAFDGLGENMRARSAYEGPGKAQAKPNLLVWVYRSVFLPIFGLIQGVARGVTFAHLTVVLCLCGLAVATCVSGMATLGLLGLMRQYSPSRSTITRVLDFDYSSPIAFAQVSLEEPPGSQHRSFMASLAHRLGYDRQDALGEDMYSQRTSQRDKGHRQYRPHEDMSPGYGHYGGGYDSGPGSQPRGWHKGRGKKGRARLPQRPVPAGQTISLTVTLDLPPDLSDLFQVSAELLDDSGQLLSKYTRMHLPRPPAPFKQAMRYTLLLPFYMMGVMDGIRTTDIKLADGYVERADSALTSVRVTLASRNATSGVLPPPPVYGGRVKVSLTLGFLHRVLGWISPSWWMSLTISVVATAITLGSGVTALVLAIVSFCLFRFSRAPTLPPASIPAPSGPAELSMDREQLQQELARMVRTTQALLDGTDVRGRGARGRLTGPQVCKLLPQTYAEQSQYEQDEVEEGGEEEGYQGEPGGWSVEEEEGAGSEVGSGGEDSIQGGSQGEDVREGREEEERSLNGNNGPGWPAGPADMSGTEGWEALGVEDSGFTGISTNAGDEQDGMSEEGEGEVAGVRPQVGLRAPSPASSVQASGKGGGQVGHVGSVMRKRSAGVRTPDL